MTTEHTTSPLVAVGMQYAHDINPNITLADHQSIESVLNMFLSNRISFKEAAPIFMRLLGTKKPLTKILTILQTPEQPIPDSIGQGIGNMQMGSMPLPINLNKSRHWTNYEDRRLLAGIHRFGSDNWQAVAMFVGNGRSKSQCCQRWARGLNPEIKKDKWLPEEEELLLQLVNSGTCKSWTSIAAKMKNRSDVQCRYHYKQMTGNESLKDEPISGKISGSVSQPAVILGKQKIILPSINEFLNDSMSVKWSLSSGDFPPFPQPDNDSTPGPSFI
ncbi:Myb-like DNA-binding domain containing protein [Tritrichomonas foetus]|uniref:Myb-like DNA-binding domain containing protein n=1 Tax=Tritrichomonas foetus TaxID=1144522 RepID=A0A1J4J5Q7_9EUKA|nr:Myb-like DNA-binding domain containing protein [Tritrichomonas foetus]|eukprot:OHS92781.1 Myb-like DNA-binding domain containing protein [Tritrichomonas foetus]